jgi:hypothetical protein
MSARVAAKVGRGDTALRAAAFRLFHAQRPGQRLGGRSGDADGEADPKVETDGVAGNAMRVKAGLAPASWWSPPAPTCSRTARKCACRESRRPLQSHRGGAAPSRADAVLHPGDRHRRRASFFKLGQREDPDFTFRAMVIRTLWPGATAEQVDRQITDRIEKKLQEVPYFRHTAATPSPASR